MSAKEEIAIWPRLDLIKTRPLKVQQSAIIFPFFSLRVSNAIFARRDVRSSLTKIHINYRVCSPVEIFELSSSFIDGVSAPFIAEFHDDGARASLISGHWSVTSDDLFLRNRWINCHCFVQRLWNFCCCVLVASHAFIDPREA